MPAKSRHTRRKIQSKKALREITNTISMTDDKSVSTAVNGGQRPVGTSSRTSSKIEIESSEVVNEIKWIGIVTGIVMLCLILAYLFFR
jgi:hypothetical protein